MSVFFCKAIRTLLELWSPRETFGEKWCRLFNVSAPIAGAFFVSVCFPSQAIGEVIQKKKEEGYSYSVARAHLAKLNNSACDENETKKILDEASTQLSEPALKYYAAKYKSALEKLDYSVDDLKPGKDLDNLCFILSFSNVDQESISGLELSDWLLARLGNRDALERYIDFLKTASPEQLGSEARHILSIGLENPLLMEIFLEMLQSDAFFTMRPGETGHWDISLFYATLDHYLDWLGVGKDIEDLVPPYRVENLFRGEIFRTKEREEYIRKMEKWLSAKLACNIVVAAPFFIRPDDELWEIRIR